MTARKNREREALERLEDALVNDVLNASDEDIIAEMKEEGIDPEQHAAQMRERFAAVVLQANKQRLLAAREAVAPARSRPFAAPAGPVDMAEARRRLRSVMASQPLTLAARKEKETEMSDADVLGLLEDLRELGLLPPDKAG